MNDEMRKSIEMLKFYWDGDTDEEVLFRLEHTIYKAKEVSPVEMPDTIVIEMQDTGSDDDMVCKYATTNVLALIQYLKFGPLTTDDTLANYERTLH